MYVYRLPKKFILTDPDSKFTILLPPDVITIRIEIGAHSGASESKRFTSLATSMKRNGV